MPSRRISIPPPWCWWRRGPSSRGPTSRREIRLSFARLSFAEEILFADLESRLSQDVVGGGHVKIDVRQHMIEQVGHALHALCGTSGLPRDGSVFSAFEL